MAEIDKIDTPQTFEEALKMGLRGATSDQERKMYQDLIMAREAEKKTGGAMSDIKSSMSDKEMNMMTPEEEIIFESLMKAGISMNTALDIMASNKVDSMNKLQQLRGETDQPVRPQEFGGLPKMMKPTAPQGQPMPMGKGAMSQQDMMAYLASKTNTTKNAMGDMLNAMGGATPMMQPQMKTPMPTGGMTPTGTQQPMMPPANPMMRR